MSNRLGRRQVLGAAAALILLPARAVLAAPRAAGFSVPASIEAASLRSIAAWLKASGRDGFVGADVADVVGIPRHAAEELLEAKQRGFRSDEVLRIAQISADARRDFLLFMVQRPEGEIYFYRASVREGLKKAFVSIPSRGQVTALERAEAEHNFQAELLYWEARAATG